MKTYKYDFAFILIFLSFPVSFLFVRGSKKSGPKNVFPFRSSFVSSQSWCIPPHSYPNFLSFWARTLCHLFVLFQVTPFSLVWSLLPSVRPGSRECFSSIGCLPRPSSGCRCLKNKHIPWTAPSGLRDAHNKTLIYFSRSSKGVREGTTDSFWRKLMGEDSAGGEERRGI